MDGEEPVKKKLSIVAVSDTHGSIKALNEILALKGDIFIHAGDFTRHGKQDNFQEFFSFLEQLNFQYKIVISGNHEIMLDNGCIQPKHKTKKLQKHPCKLERNQIITQLKKRSIYLEHQAINIEGINIFGSPYTPVFCNTAFQYEPKLDEVIWSKIPKGIDLLITHGPPHSILDKTHKGSHVGSKALKQMSMLRKPKYHIFGHIHESQGMQKENGITFINVAKQPTRFIL